MTDLVTLCLSATLALLIVSLIHSNRDDDPPAGATSTGQDPFQMLTC